MASDLSARLRSRVCKAYCANPTLANCTCYWRASACLRAALGIDRAAADAVHEPESKP